MARNWLEETVAELYRLNDVDPPMPKTDRRKVRGHSVDILAINDKEIIHIECQTWWGGHKKDDEEDLLRKLKEKYEESEKSIPEKFPAIKALSEKHFGNRQFKRIFITSGKPYKSRGGPWDRLEKFCNNNNIELKKTSDILKEFIEKIGKLYPSLTELVGKEESYVTQTIMQLHFAKLLKLG